MANHYKSEEDKQAGLADLARWKRIHMKDPEYRASIAARQRVRMEALRRDAEFGRIARSILQYIGAMMFDVGKPAELPQAQYRSPGAEAILYAMKRPFTPEQTKEYFELWKDAEALRRKRRGTTPPRPEKKNKNTKKKGK